MSYRVLITEGKGNRFVSVGSTPLKNKTAVINWIKKQPLNRNAKTEISYRKKRIVGKKWFFYNVKKIKFI